MPPPPRSQPLAVGALLAGQINRVDDHVGALRGFDGPLKRYLAGSINPAGENDDGLAPLLLQHQFICGKVNRVVQRGAHLPMARSASASGISASAGRIVIGVFELRLLERIQSRVQLLF